MKTRLLSFVLLSFLWILQLSAQVGIGNTNPQAQLDISASNVGTPTNLDGILIPRVSNLASPGSMTSLQDGMLVFYTGIANSGKGFYYWNHTLTSWIPIIGSINQVNAGEGLTGGGNSGTITIDAVGTNGITTAANDFRLGGTLIQNTTITQGIYDLTHNLNSSGEFNIQDAGNTRFHVSNTGLVSVGSANTAGNFNVTGTSFFSNDLYLRDGSVNSGDVLARLYDNADDGIFDIYQNNSVSTRIHGNGVSYFNGGKVAIGQGTANGFLDIRATNLPSEPHINLIENSASGARINFSNTGTTNGNVWTLFGDTDNIAANSRFNIFHQGTGNIMVITGDGEVGIGDTTPEATLDVNGSFQYTDGNQVNGYLLTTDASGNASWTNPSTISVVSAINGLTTTGNQVRLGGTLNQNTTITQGVYDLTHTLSSSGEFIIQDNTVPVVRVDANGITHFGDDTYWHDVNSSGTIIAQLLDDGDDGYFRLLENGSNAIILDANGNSIFNEQSLDRDFRIESQGNSGMFFLDGENSRVSIGALNNAGTFNVTGNSYFSDDIYLRDGAVNSGDVLARLYDSGDDGILDLYEDNLVNHRIHGNGTSVFNEQGNNNADFRIESDTRPYLFWTDASADVIRIGNNDTNGYAENGTSLTVNGLTTTIDYVADFELGVNNRNTTVGIGSTEFLHDAGNLYVMLHGRLLPYDDNVRSLGTSNWRWQSLWAGDGTINTSDLRQKKNIKPLQYGLDELMQIETLTFNWKKSSNPSTKIGFSAQNLLEVLPEVVITEESITIDEVTGAEEMRPVANLGVYYSDIIPVTVKAIQELNTKVKTLEEENALLRQQLNQLQQIEARLKALENNQ